MKTVEGYSHSWVVILLSTGTREKTFRCGTFKGVEAWPAGVGRSNGKLDWKSGAEWLEASSCKDLLLCCGVPGFRRTPMSSLK